MPEAAERELAASVLQNHRQRAARSDATQLDRGPTLP